MRFGLISLIYLSPLVIASFVPNAFLIEFEKSPHTTRHVKRSQFYDQLHALDIQFDIQYEYDLIHAVSVRFKSARDAQLFLKNTTNIKRVWPVVNSYHDLVRQFYV